MPEPYFRLFSPVHWAILASVPALAGCLAWAFRRTAWAGISPAFGVALLVNELIWYGYRLREEGFRFPDGLPLQLCDLSLWLTVVALLAHKPLAFELAYYWGVAGSGMAILTPDLWEPFPSYPTVYFFLAHGGVVAAQLFLIWSGLARPRPGSVWRAFAALNSYAVLMGVFNWIFQTNYLYLCQKPAGASLLDYFGGWPWYLAAGDLAGLLLFAVLWLPFRGRSRQ